MRNFFKNLLHRLTPLSVKRSLFAIWHERDIDFWLYTKIVVNENNDLFRPRFVWSDLEEPLRLIQNRFGAAHRVYLMTDRADVAANRSISPVTIEQLRHADPEKHYPVICAFESDEKLAAVLAKLQGMGNVFYYCPSRYLPAARYFYRNDLAREVLTSELNLNHGKFDLADFETIIQVLEMTRTVPGDYVEIGVYRGDSAHAALTYMNRAGIKRLSYFLDLFDGFTDDTSRISQDAVWLNTHTDTSMHFVKEFLHEFRDVEVLKANIIEQDLPATVRSIAVCNIDVDLYEAIKAALAKAAPRMARGGVIILEDQGHTPFLGGSYLASLEFVESVKGSFVPVQMTSGQMLLIKL